MNDNETIKTVVKSLIIILLSYSVVVTLYFGDYLLKIGAFYFPPVGINQDIKKAEMTLKEIKSIKKASGKIDLSEYQKQSDYFQMMEKIKSQKKKMEQSKTTSQ